MQIEFKLRKKSLSLLILELKSFDIGLKLNTLFCTFFGYGFGCGQFFIYFNYDVLISQHCRAKSLAITKQSPFYIFLDKVLFVCCFLFGMCLKMFRGDMGN